MDKRAKERIEGFFNYHMEQIQQCCDVFPTCEGCPKNKKHTGCYFRGKSPKDWKTGKRGKVNVRKSNNNVYE